jgi:hypothetical protein
MTSSLSRAESELEQENAAIARVVRHKLTTKPL